MADRPSGYLKQTRSVVHAKNGMVVTSHPLAAMAGLQILQQGGNAFDAAVATASVLCAVEPMMTGLGGDMFALIYDAKKREVKGLNASGHAPQAATLDFFEQNGFTSIPSTGILSSTVPGVVDGWSQLLQSYGTLTFKEVLAPAIRYAEEGYPIPEMVAYYWKKAEQLLLQSEEATRKYLIDGKAPKEGTLFKQPDLAWSLKQIAKDGRDAFYQGGIADKIDEFMKNHHGLLRKEDLKEHRSRWVTPISTNYHGYEVLEIPPNGQGLVVLQMLNILENYDLKAIGHNSPEYVRLFIEAKKLAYADRDRYIADSEFADIPIDRLLSKEYAKELADLIQSGQKISQSGVELGGDTVYLTVADKEGNVASVTNSIFSLFGSGVLIPNTGIFMHNRGSLFSLDRNHPNALQPGKRPFHTIIPGLVLKDQKPLISFGVMGADMQPQGQVQTLVNMIDFGMNVQAAGDAPRFRHYNHGIFLESEISQKIRQELSEQGYTLLEQSDGDDFVVGGYQGIFIDPETGLFKGGSDPRKDGCAIGF
ncbi:gamma-glutamyltransferase [Ammoniphilus sp. 3BR4]|uniref:gamma-glutamyltransferase n=1 Tax=Ammoniphilus sp. 3BR4 TaxID=3158265 RepID=UPI0034666D3D